MDSNAFDVVRNDADKSDGVSVVNIETISNLHRQTIILGDNSNLTLVSEEQRLIALKEIELQFQAR